MSDSPKQRVVEALRRLPVLPGREDSIDDEALWIVLAAGLSRTQDARGAQRAGTLKAGKGLEELLEALAKVESAFSDLPREAWEALEAETKQAEARRKENEARGIYRRSDRTRPPLLHRAQNAAFATVVAAAREHLAEAEATTGSRPRKNAAPAVTKQARKAYKRLTGLDRKATYDPVTTRRYGPFVDLLEDVFDALEIDASAASQASNA